MLPELTNKIFENWTNLFPKRKQPRSLHYLGIPGSVEGGTATFLAFAQDKDPLFVVKVHRSPQAQSLVEQETATLKRLQKLGERIASSVPQVLFAGQIGQTCLLVQTVLNGCPMPASLSSLGLPELKETDHHLTMASHWLIHLAEKTGKNTTGETSENVQRIHQMIDTFEKIFETCRLGSSFLNKLRETVDQINLWPLSHGDFCRHNLLLTKDSKNINVIDWTLSQKAALPLEDFFFFLTTYFLQIRKKHGIEGFSESFHYTFFQENSYQKLIWKHLIQHSQSLYLSLYQIAPLFALFLMKRSLWEYYQLVRCTESGFLPRFAVFLASLQNKNYHDAPKAQLWIHFFQMFLKKMDLFIPKNNL